MDKKIHYWQPYIRYCNWIKCLESDSTLMSICLRQDHSFSAP